MGYFNPISYFIKSFIRLFTKKFFWIILLCIGIFVGYLLFSNGVFAESSFYLVEDYFLDSTITKARNLIGDDIYNNSDYDIFIGLQPGWSLSGTEESGAYYVYIDTTNIPNDTIYTIPTSNDYTFTNSYGTWNRYRMSINSSSDFSASFKQQTIYIPDWYVSSPGATKSNNSIILDSWCKSNNFGLYLKPIRTHYDICDSDGNLIFAATNPPIVNPYFITTDEQLQTFDFDYLQINGGTTPYYTEISEGVGGNATLSLTYFYSGVETIIDLTNYITVNSDNTWSVNIPYNSLTNNVIVRNGEEFSYVFTYTPFYRYSRNCK